MNDRRYHECFEANFETGELIWKPRPPEHFAGPRHWKTWNTKWAGKPAGSIHKGYRFVRFQVFGVNKNEFVHRILWAMRFGSVPPALDHINGDPMDNRIANLRPASMTDNGANRPAIRSGLKGCYLFKRLGLYRAQIKRHGKSTCLGYFKTEEQAHQAYVEAAKRIHGEFAKW